MTFDEAVSYYGTSMAMTNALGLRPNVTFSWLDRIIPPIHQLRLEAMTDGDLRADDSAWEPAPPRYPKRKRKST